MAQEDEIPQSLRDLNDLLKTLNNTVETASERQKKYQERLANTNEALKKLAAEANGSAEKLKEYEEKKKAYEADNVKRARSLAREQLEAEKETKSLAYQFMMARGTSVESQKALLVWGDRLKSTGAILSTLGGGVGKFAADLAQGNSKFTALNPVIDSVSGALGKMAESIPFAGAALSGAMKLAAEGAKFMLQQLQAATEAFQDISRVGASGARGISGLMQQFQASGMTLQGFVNTVKNNSQTLASFGGTAAKGAESLSKISKNIVDSRAGDYLRRLGFTADEMGESTAQYIAQQQRLGVAQGKSFRELAQGSAAYMRELDTLAKVTGQSREELQKTINSQMREGRFLSTLRMMERQNQGAQANELKKLSVATAGYNDELSQAIRDASSGIYDSEVVKQFARAGVDVVGAVQQIKSGGATAEQAFRGLQNQVNRQIPQQERMNQILNANNKTYPTLYKMVDFAAAKFDAAGAKTEQSGAQTDKLTGSAADAQKSMEQMSRQVSALATTILPNFATAIAKVTGVLNQSLQKMGVPGVVGAPPAPAGAPPATKGPAFRAPGAPPATKGPAFGAPEAAKPGDMGEYLKMVAQRESGGRNIANIPRAGQTATSAHGLYQITADTFNRLVANAPPGSPLRGKTFEDMKTDVNLQTEAMKQLTSSNEQLLRNRGLSTSDAAKYMTHMLGYPKARDVLEAPSNRPLSSIVPKDWLEKNNLSRFQTAGDLRQHFDKITGGKGYKFGGIASGPSSGYLAQLHGTEAIIPMTNNQSIKVEMPDFSGGMNQQIQAITSQISRLDELISLMRRQTTVSEKILQVSQA